MPSIVMESGVNIGCAVSKLTPAGHKRTPAQIAATIKKRISHSQLEWDIYGGRYKRVKLAEPRLREAFVAFYNKPALATFITKHELGSVLTVDKLSIWALSAEGLVKWRNSGRRL